MLILGVAIDFTFDFGAFDLVFFYLPMVLDLAFGTPGKKDAATPVSEPGVSFTGGMDQGGCEQIEPSPSEFGRECTTFDLALVPAAKR